jgi:hypothetical protein
MPTQAKLRTLYFKNKIKTKGLESRLRCKSAYARPWFQSPGLQKKKKFKKLNVTPETENTRTNTGEILQVIGRGNEFWIGLPKHKKQKQNLTNKLQQTKMAVHRTGNNQQREKTACRKGRNI